MPVANARVLVEADPPTALQIYQVLGWARKISYGVSNLRHVTPAEKDLAFVEQSAIGVFREALAVALTPHFCNNYPGGEDACTDPSCRIHG